MVIFLSQEKEQTNIKSTLCSKLRQRWVKMCFPCVLNALKEKFEKEWRLDLETENSIIDVRLDWVTKCLKHWRIKKNPKPNNHEI